MTLAVKVALSLSQTSPGVYDCIADFLKTLWEKEKLLGTSNFSFSHSVFNPFRELSAIFIKFEIVCKLFQFGSLKFVVWETVKPQYIKPIKNNLDGCRPRLGVKNGSPEILCVFTRVIQNVLSLTKEG